MLQLSLELPRKPFTISIQELTVETGSTLCLFGPSGSGKSSILSVIAGFETGCQSAYLAVNGRVLIDTSKHPRISCPPWRRNIAYMEQSARLFPHLTVEQNILYGTRRDVDRAWITTIIEATGLQQELRTHPSRLSGGMSQRVALARALATKPNVLLLDEPFSALDWLSRRSLQDLIREVRARFSMTIILVTHQFTEAQRLADHIALMDQGKILQVGSPRELIEQPASWRAAALVGYTSRIEAPDGASLWMHPDRVVMGHKPGLGTPIPVVVEDVTWHEGRQQVTLSVRPPWQASGTMEVNLPPTEAVQIGEPMEITVLSPRQQESSLADLAEPTNQLVW
ncbi:ABC transporter ATP-binding protein [Alicyclobacillus cycloheptanicus]|uniref:ABC-type Fe3+/spermidine/putrescine transport system ATPase subunit n=1 Tax=Alicyclobacillus cycloheptanicus TaxID=1457 RepID=A0ABT9XM44_9BACL|nr:ABC transporter ATP-binding protein [Alicyclobacillus cycloheptanicus]MDQ0191297.1 ABC-type Fe3+/spermidine/putrescine transport system ATPase subunit [Alicyclobacillus cycloheptanicus]WDM02417.1 ABC transporter ATP-binding protein [Alicyclobacillus cycloheptanicus]